MHLIELRSGPQGHPNYRHIAQEMHRLIAEHAGHRLIVDAMSFADLQEHGLERLDAGTTGRSATSFGAELTKSTRD